MLIQASNSALTSIIDRLSIEFASNLHRVCIGFATEDYWRNIGGELRVLLLKIPLGVFDIVLSEALCLILLGLLDEFGRNAAP